MAGGIRVFGRRGLASPSDFEGPEAHSQLWGESGFSHLA